MYQREVVLHVRRGRSLRCWRAKRLLKRKGYHFEVVETTEEPPRVCASGSPTGGATGARYRTSSSAVGRWAG
jgi:hypothetical protein